MQSILYFCGQEGLLFRGEGIVLRQLISIKKTISDNLRITFVFAQKNAARAALGAKQNNNY